MLGYLIGAFLLYFLYKLVVGLIIPVVKTTNAMRRKMQQMQQPPQNPFERSKESNVASRPSHKKETSTRKDDYIDFEEIKEHP